MPANTWTCPGCRTVNSRHTGACMVCGAAQATAAATPIATGEMPTLKVEVVPPPSKESGRPSSRAIKAGGTLSDSAVPRTTFASAVASGASPTVASGASPTAAAPSVTSAMPAPPTATIYPATPAAPTPTVRPAARKASRSGRPAGGARKFAVGKLLGVGHIALFVSAIQLFLFHPHWGMQLMAWVSTLAARIGGPVTPAVATSWESNGLINDSWVWLSHLPWGLSANIYFILAIACLIVRLRRSTPGWLSLVVALPAAVYGLLVGISRIPVLAIYWPLTVLTFVAAWIVVGKTVRRY
jgi:hypothetical protein